MLSLEKNGSTLFNFTHTNEEGMANNRRTELTELCRLIITAMNDICARNRDAQVGRTPFHSMQIPPMSLHDYSKRIFKYSHCSEECFPVTLILISRYLCRQPDSVKLSFYNSHRLFITALMISAKLRDDEYYSNAYYSSIGGVSPAEMNALELQLLKDLDWDLYVDAEEFYTVVTACEEGSFANFLEHTIRRFKQAQEESRAQKAQVAMRGFPSKAPLESAPSAQAHVEVPIAASSPPQDVSVFPIPAAKGSKDSLALGVESETSSTPTPTTRTPTKVHFEGFGPAKSRRRRRNE